MTGPGARSALDRFAGTHRVQRVPANGHRGRRQTSTATIAVLNPVEPVAAVVDDADLRIDRIRGHGAGGQRRNKVATAIRLTHLPTGIVITRMSGRSQAANLTDAKAELEQRLRDASSQRAAAALDKDRATQVTADRAAKSFTHCWYRDKVTEHSTGDTWTVRAWHQGRM